MRILHVPYTFFPDAMGGTEVYVAALCRVLRERDVDCHIAAPGNQNQAYAWSEMAVHRFAIGEPTLGQLYGEGDPVAAANFGRLLDQVRPDVLHLHAHTSAVSRLIAREAQARKIRLVLTCHSPTVTCSRGTMMLFGETPCDGILHRRRCAACTAHAHGASRPVAAALGWLPPEIGQRVGRSGRSGGIWTGLQLSALTRTRHTAVKELLHSADRVVAVCDWLHDLLLRNGVPAGKLVRSRQGLPFLPADAPAPHAAREADSSGRVLRFAYLGRLDPTKGVETIIDALRRLPGSLPAMLDIFGIVQPGNEAYRARLESLAEGDPRVRFRAPVGAESTVRLLRAYDALLVPSIGVETGPLVVLEAFAAGIPVIGSRRGGIAELVRHEGDGLLVEPGNANAWADALARFVRDDELRCQLTGGVRPPRTALEVAEDMLGIYEELLTDG